MQSAEFNILFSHVNYLKIEQKAFSTFATMILWSTLLNSDSDSNFITKMYYKHILYTFCFQLGITYSSMTIILCFIVLKKHYLGSQEAKAIVLPLFEKFSRNKFSFKILFYFKYVYTFVSVYVYVHIGIPMEISRYLVHFELEWVLGTKNS